jgi:predicted peptidase
LFLVCFSGCGEGGSSINDPEPIIRTPEDVISDFKAFDIKPGVNDLSLESLSVGAYWNFRVIVPESANEGNLRPLVMTFHGASGGSPTAHEHTSCYDEPGLEALDAYIISANAGQDEWFDRRNQQMVLALIDLSQTNWFVDANKVMATGYSNGGNASWWYPDNYPHLFSVGIPMASSYDPVKLDGTTPRIDVPLYVIHGENDEVFPLAATQTFVDESRAAGTDIEFVIAPGLTHFQACEYVDVLKTAVTWVTTEIWN